MKILVIDTETNGLPKQWGANPEHYHLFPEILSISWIMWDTKTDKVEENYFVINREIEKWDKYAMEVNGFSQERLEKEGKSWHHVFMEFTSDLLGADLLAAHNISFDWPIIRADTARMNPKIGILSDFSPKYCTMKETTSLCKIPAMKGVNGIKWPKLTELYEFLFHKPMEEEFKAHNALEDTRATLKCFKELVKMGLVEHVNALNS